jgi:hypothetical protein
MVMSPIWSVPVPTGLDASLHLFTLRLHSLDDFDRHGLGLEENPRLALSDVRYDFV